jgi:O-antigen/teichoic acid export membrane protein
MLKIIASNFGVRLSAAIFNLLIAILVSQFLGASGKGEQSIILASITIILLVDNIIGGASIIYLTTRVGIKNLLVTCYFWSLTVSLFCFFTLSFFEVFDQNKNIAISLISGLNSLISINSSILVGKEKIQKSNLLIFCVPFLTVLIIGIELALNFNHTIEIYLNAIYIAYSSTFILSLILIRFVLSDNDFVSFNELPKTFKKLLFYGLQNQIAHVFQLLSFRISYFVLASHQGQKEVGIYSNGLSIIESIWLITSSISIYQYSKISNSNDKEYSLKLTEKLTKLGLLLALISLFIAMLIPSDFYILIFGKEFGELSTIIRLMAPGVWIYNYVLIYGHFFSGIGKYYVNAIVSFSGFAITVLLSFLIFQKLTIYHSALIAVLSYFTSAIVIIYFYRKEGGNLVIFPSWSEIKEFKNQLSVKRL